MSAPLVSVVLPVHNGARYLDEAIRSVLAQTYADMELIVVDDGSTDETPHIVARHESAVRYVRQEHSGVSAARNKGIALSRGSYIGFIDSDDEWEPEKIATQVGRLESKADAVASFTGVLRVDERIGSAVAVTPPPAMDMVAALVLHSNLLSGGGSAALIRRSALAQAGGFDTELAQGEDWDLWIRLAALGPLDITSAPLVRRRVHETNASRDVWRMERDNLRVLEKFFANSDLRERYGHLRRRAYSNHYVIFSGSYLWARDIPAAVRCLARAAAYRPSALLYALALPLRAARRRLAGRP